MSIYFKINILTTGIKFDIIKNVHERMRANVFLWACLLEGRVEEIQTDGRWEYMTVFEALSLMMQAGILLISLLIYIETKYTKK